MKLSISDYVKTLSLDQQPRTVIGFTEWALLKKVLSLSMIKMCLNHQALRESIYNIVQDDKVNNFTVQDTVWDNRGFTGGLTFNATPVYVFGAPTSPVYSQNYHTAYNNYFFAYRTNHEFTWGQIRTFFNKMMLENVEFLISDSTLDEYFRNELYYSDGSEAVSGDNKLAMLYYLYMIINKSSEVDALNDYNIIKNKVYVAGQTVSNLNMPYLIRSKDQDWIGETSYATSKLLPGWTSEKMAAHMPAGAQSNYESIIPGLKITISRLVK